MARGAEGLAHIYVVNNGHAKSCDWIESPYITVLQAGDNLGWEGGLKLGLQHSTAPYVMFLNDDVHIPFSSCQWLTQLLQHFKNPKVGAVGPSTNVVMGMQNIFASIHYSSFPAKFLVGYCFLTKREIFDSIGGVDDTLPGGDDLDMSIRLRDAGYKLIVDREVFIYHHGFKTGVRVHGDHNTANGWNSYEFKEKTDFALIKKHGLKKWWECMKGLYEYDFDTTVKGSAWEDTEGAFIRERIKPGVVLDLGCGGNKTIPDSIGIDFVPKDETVETLQSGTVSSADVSADVSQGLPVKDADTIIARHILEHMQDPITAIKHWLDSLKPDGILIIAVPLEGLVNSIPMNIEHKCSWNPKSMRVMLELLGLEINEQLYSENGISFITIARRRKI